jgi:hypothetical protein
MDDYDFIDVHPKVLLKNLSSGFYGDYYGAAYLADFAYDLACFLWWVSEYGVKCCYYGSLDISTEVKHVLAPFSSEYAEFVLETYNIDI